jgi:hypothetical protein
MTTFLLAAVCAFLASPAPARTLLTQKEALALAFPAPLTVERRTAYLTAEQVQAAEEKGRVKIASRVWSYYVGRSTAGTAGYAYFETHVVRSETETFMAVLDAGGSVRFVELLAFAEPDDYKPNPSWLAQFQRRSLKDDLMVHRAIRNITGASLTSEALTAGVRRILAVHSMIAGQNRILGPK